MNLHSFIVIQLSVALFLPCASSKTLPKRTEIDREPEQHESSNQSESFHNAHHHSFMHGMHLSLGKHRRSRTSEIGGSDQNHREYAITYENPVPIGILQRLRDNYQLLPLHAEESILVDVNPIQRNEDEKKGAIEVEEGQEDKGRDRAAEAQFADESHPYIFTKSKTDSHGKNGSSKMFEKREINTLHKHPLFSTRSLGLELPSIGTNKNNKDVEFKGILSDMGLMEEPLLDKREVELNEDKNMDLDTNNIDLIKIEGKPEGQAKSVPAKRSQWAFTEHYEQIQYPEPRAVNEDQHIEEYINTHQRIKQYENERQKRANDIEKQMEKRIKERLQKIKEEVRSEIDHLKAGNDEEGEEEDGEENAGENNEEDDNVQRWKRNIINNLMEEETSDLNPVMAIDENPVSHIRRRRSVQVPEKDYLATTENHFQLRRLLEFTNELNRNEIKNAEEEIPLRRDKKGCLCEDRKGCKCDRQKFYITRPDESSSVDLDEATMMNIVPHKVPATDISDTSNNFRSDLDVHTLPPKQENTKLKESAYTLDIGPDSYKISADKDGWLQARRKSNSFLDLVAVHGGAPVLEHLIAIKERSMLPKVRSKRIAIEKEKPQLLSLSALSENDLFGVLPKKFEEDQLARFKRI
ncbi:uncharacterized protein [Euwallacea fornicatus]|uniref:uncharacterized protein n=1 Tax=Euwallacea fornicatus TaxID=995702 RepID=UPI00338D6364